MRRSSSWRGDREKSIIGQFLGSLLWLGRRRIRRLPAPREAPAQPAAHRFHALEAELLERADRGEVLGRAVGEHRLRPVVRSEEHTSELQSLMRTSYAVFCLQKK